MKTAFFNADHFEAIFKHSCTPVNTCAVLCHCYPFICVFRYPLIHSLIPGIPEQPTHLAAVHSRRPGSTVPAGPCWGNRGWGRATGQTKQCFCWPGMWPKTLGHSGYKNISCVLASSESPPGCC